SRVGPLVALSQAKDMRAAIGNALEHLEKQALKNKTRIITRKRRNHKERDAEVATPAPVLQNAAAAASATSVSMVIHKLPALAKYPDVHLVRIEDAVATPAMYLAGAIKDTQSSIR